MRIATWNVERLKHWRSLEAITRSCDEVEADILVLTETDRRLKPEFRFCYHTPLLSEIRPDYYGRSENRVSIHTKYPCRRRLPTYDPYTAICVELETERGPLLVYGTIMGIYGNRHQNFMEDLTRQLQDLALLSEEGPLCIAGDYNLSFSDNYYYTKAGRSSVLETCSALGIRILTADRGWCIDHIAVSTAFLGDVKPTVDEWNQGKTLSDHKGIVVDF